MAWQQRWHGGGGGGGGGVRAHVHYVRYLMRVMFERSLYLHLWLSLARSAFFTWRESFSALPP